MSTPKWHAANGATAPSSPSANMEITAYPTTDIWRRDATPAGDVFNAPYIYITTTSKNFKRLATTVTVPWKTQFDQGGLLISFPNTASSEPDKACRWIKAGIELFEGKPALGVVGTDRFSDWSLAPMPRGAGGEEGDQRTARFEAVRDGTTLWVYVVVGGERQALREVKWAFLDEGEDGNGVEMKLGVYAAKPTPNMGDERAGVEVSFEGLEAEIEGA
ncbi:hypothetical protein LTR78_000776 [Recurvomyces mirabilis]|uniref:Uncharacterized protein n=1 Tax=Recurvomyces mirabilis TaxID=574656 RepID=A0AAE0WX54_9PEZI|nr:hypothetical protein LTR78_000776 [Recurvomyces mirabilis]KAK5158745.1 hypothetical protein LTS14_002853 [Recurvomyces mirabilis]